LAAMKLRKPDDCGEIVERWRRERGVPRLVVLRSFDRRLPIDLDNPLLVAALAHHVRRLDGAWLEELYPGPEDLCVEAPEGRYSHEILLPYLKSPAASPRAGMDRETPADAGERPAAEIFPPGADWLYLKLYGSGALLERLLTRSLGPWVRALRQEQRISRWFFVRYADPGTHLRLRLQCRPGELAPVLAELRGLAEEGMAEASLDRVEIDTYERESERYGGRAAIALAERVFEADSEAVLDLLEAHDGRVPWWLCLAGADALLADFGLDLGERWRLARSLRDAYRREFAHDRDFPHRAGARFRRVRAELSALMGEGGTPEPLAARSRALAPAAAELRALAAGGQLSRPLPEIVASFVHMHLDRMLRGELRAQEAVLYDWLFRLYDARWAQRARPEAEAPVLERSDP
ncbi:MAG TPA: thiopeptide-type bacteriocin biosynthesis protein, partial [Thermoanaerobaculia bacterium]